MELLRLGPAQTTASDVVRWQAVHLDVTDGERSLRFWRDLIGLRLRASDEDGLHLGVDDADLLVLHPGAARGTQRGHSGLYHLAIHLPSETEFARVLGRLLTARYPNAPTDHIMHWATYLDDPDGIGLELSFETLDRFAAFELDGGRPAIRDSEGRLRGATEALDLDAVFSHLPDRDVTRPLAAGTRVGHVHLHVADVAQALAFYQRLGFVTNIDMAAMGFADMTADGSFPHRLAVNTWQGVGAPRRPAGTAGLNRLTLAGAGPAFDGATVEDPAGNRIELIGIGGLAA